MLKKSMFFAAVASMVMATSCSQEDLATTQLSSNEISVNPSMGLKTRAVETTISNLGSFTVNAFQDGAANYMDGVKYTSTDGSVWNTDAGKFYWPVEGKLHFYAYAPNEPGQTGTFKLDKDAQAFTDFTPNAAAADQKDFVYTKATGDMATNGKTGIDLTFQHALSEITIAAKNTNTAYTVEVTGVKIGNVVTKGTFTFPSTTGTSASWSLSSEASDLGSYTTTWDAATTLGSDVSTLNVKNVPFMIIPQQLEKTDKASDKAYIAVKVKITMQGGWVIRDGWSYVGIDTNWEMGKRYAYTLDYSNGAGQDENGKQIISGTTVNLNCTVTSWTELNEVKDLTPPLPLGANCIIMDVDNLSKVYSYYPCARINTFWSNPDVGDAANVISDDTEWTAEVIWQDIDHRAINFCDAKGKIIEGNIFKGKGKQQLYIKAATSTPGNVVVGVKKTGTGNHSYLWSWHLWLTQEPQELEVGIMDRNLGATSASLSDGRKCFGLYYEYGRKDPFAGPSTKIYDINGTLLYTTTNSKDYLGPVSFATAVQNPTTYYTSSTEEITDWVSPNYYTKTNWNNFSNSAKSLFDPSPEGWKIISYNFSNILYTAYKNNALYYDISKNYYMINDTPLFSGAGYWINGSMANWEDPFTFMESVASSNNKSRAYTAIWAEEFFGSTPKARYIYIYSGLFNSSTTVNVESPFAGIQYRDSGFPVRCVKE